MRVAVSLLSALLLVALAAAKLRAIRGGAAGAGSGEHEDDGKESTAEAG